MPEVVLVFDSVYDRDLMSPPVQLELRKFHKDRAGGNDWYGELDPVEAAASYPILAAWVDQYITEEDLYKVQKVVFRVWW